MTREIKTPADAEPREIYDETDKIEYYFTAAECAQIARRMRVLQDELDDTSKAPAAAKEIIEWERLFLKWTA